MQQSFNKIEKTGIYIILMFSLIFNVLLIFKNNELKQSLFLEKRGGQKSQIIVGKKVSPLIVKDIDKNEVVFNYDTPTVIYSFSSECHWCDRNLLNFKQLFETVGKDFQIIAVSIDDYSNLSRYVKVNNISFPVYYNISENQQSELELQFTPSTYVISREGKIIKHWAGAFSDSTKVEIEEFFNVQLPSLSQ